jgi:hypothetical protein
MGGAIGPSVMHGRMRGLPEQLRRLVTEHPGAGGIFKMNIALEIDPVDALADGIEDHGVLIAETLESAPGIFAFGDVEQVTVRG